MYSLMVQSTEWEEGPNAISYDRFLEATETSLRQRIDGEGQVNSALLESIPALFIQEDFHENYSPAKIGRVSHVRRAGGSISFEVTFERNASDVSRKEIHRLCTYLQILLPTRGLTELNRTHWAVKDVDLFRVLFTQLRKEARSPSIFRIPTSPVVNPNQLSAMMPFGPQFARVYEAIQTAANANGMACNRADDIWDNPAIIDDVANLIDRSSLIVIDCTGKNANVFYELGLAHAWGKQVIIITQNAADIPFDLQHIRYISYHNNGEGCTELASRLRERIESLRR
ncbi:hypothetical protein ACIPI6_14485 [Pseudomonas protegens]|uniref:hypothetical protein n=1 Tax=Pseudomonas protegens TaxID=380021 RepID=UPI003821FA4E